MEDHVSFLRKQESRQAALCLLRCSRVASGDLATWTSVTFWTAACAGMTQAPPHPASLRWSRPLDG